MKMNSNMVSSLKDLIIYQEIEDLKLIIQNTSMTVIQGL